MEAMQKQLQEIEELNDQPNEIRNFYKAVKRMTKEGYTILPQAQQRRPNKIFCEKKKLEQRCMVFHCVKKQKGKGSSFLSSAQTQESVNQEESENETQPWTGGDNGLRPLRVSRKHELRIATWNVRTMLKPGRMKEMADEMQKYRIDVMGLQEIRWRGQRRIDKKEYTLLYSGIGLEDLKMTGNLDLASKNVYLSNAMVKMQTFTRFMWSPNGEGGKKAK
ncbi:hypothetical protein J437_LFUL015882, partial [Ladona fulva]